MAVTITSSFTPPVSIDLKKNAAAPQTSPLVTAAFNLARPAVDVDVPLFGRLHVAPWGEPDPEAGGRLIFAVGAVLVVVVVLAVYGAWRLVRR